MRIFTLVTAATLVLTPVISQAADLITKPSTHSVSETIDRLAAAVKAAGAKVVARVNHSGAAASVGMKLRPTQMLMFGNPKLGTPAMQAGQTAGLDLPLRVLAYQDENGQVFVVYHNPAELSATHGIPADAAVLKKMAGALDKLTNKAVGE